MRIVLTLLVQGEIDVIDPNLEYHLAQGIEHIIVTDNGSQDGTREILARHAARGGVTVIHEPPSDSSQHLWVTHMARGPHRAWLPTE